MVAQTEVDQDASCLKSSHAKDIQRVRANGTLVLRALLHYWGSWEKTLANSQEQHVAMDRDYNPERNLVANHMGALCTHVSVWSPPIFSTSR